MKAIEINSLSKKFKNSIALDNISLDVEESEIFGFLGPNGAGKTTTLKAISNLLSAERGEVTKGSIKVMGERVDALTPNELVRRGVIQVMEGRHSFEHLTVEENLLTGAYTRRDSKALINSDIEKVYHYFPRLKDRRNSTAGYTSGGEQQMLAISRALVAKPRLIMLDEPSLGLSPILVDQLFELIKTLNKEGIAILLVEQNTKKALEVATRGYVMELGSVVLKGLSGALAEDSGLVHAYLGAQS